MMEIRNPVKLPTDLYPAEEHFTRCLAEGEFCRIGDGELPKEGIESGEGANVVRGKVIRFFAFGGNEENPVLGPGICLQGAWISGIFDLTHTNIPYALLFTNSDYFTLGGFVLQLTKLPISKTRGVLPCGLFMFPPNFR